MKQVAVQLFCSCSSLFYYYFLLFYLTCASALNNHLTVQLLLYTYRPKCRGRCCAADGALLRGYINSERDWTLNKELDLITVGYYRVTGKLRPTADN